MITTNHPNQAPCWFVVVVMLTLLWTGRFLQDAWTKDLLNQNGLFAFIIWLTGSLIFALRSRSEMRNLSWWITALVICLAGKFTHLKALNQVAIAFAVGGILPNLGARLACLVGAVAWTTSLSWISIRFFYCNPDLYRIPIALASLFLIAFFCEKRTFDADQK